MGIYERVGALPADPILGIAAEFDEDPREKKVFLAVGVYKDEDGSCKRMEAVYEAEKKIIDTEPSKVYLPIEGNKKFLDETLLLILGEKLVAKYYPQIAKIQALGGTGAFI
jgi:aspartate/tyrosine/aromatic aminotransferase